MNYDPSGQSDISYHSDAGNMSSGSPKGSDNNSDGIGDSDGSDDSDLEHRRREVQVIRGFDTQLFLGCHALCVGN